MTDSVPDKKLPRCLSCYDYAPYADCTTDYCEKLKALSAPSTIEPPQDWKDIFVEYEAEGRSDAWLYQQIEAHSRRADAPRSATQPTDGADVWPQWVKSCEQIAALRVPAANWELLKKITGERGWLPARLLGCDSTSSTLDEAMDKIRLSDGGSDTNTPKGVKRG